MPRVCTSANDPLDYCVRCFPSEKGAKTRYGNIGHGPDRRGNCFEHNADHPSYGGEDYNCTRCKKVLTDDDN